MDPQLLSYYEAIELASADMLQRVYAGFDILVTLQPGQWTRWSVQGAGLVRTTSGVQ